MKTNPARRLAAFLLAALLLAASRMSAQTLASGTYRATAELGAVLLDGRYPLELDEVPGEIELSTSPTGVLVGRVKILDQWIDVAGQITLRTAYARVVLRSKVASKRLLLRATLQGGAFVGHLQLGHMKTACRFNVAATGPARPEYLLTLKVAGNGTITGVGTLSLARQQVALKARGRVQDGRVSLSVQGGKTFLRTTTGVVEGAGFQAAKWTAQGFGALTKGVALPVEPSAP